MNTRNNIMVVCERSHPMFSEISKYYLVKNIDEAIASYETYDLIFDLTILRSDKKILFLKELAKTSRAEIISDLTCTFQEKMFQNLPQVKASISSFFYTPTNTCEYYFRPDLELHFKKAIGDIIIEFCNKIKMIARESIVMEITFVTPRVVTQIINEAYFALEEKLATTSDIDSAMVAGVNYPMGPIKWCEHTGIKNVLLILEELYHVTKDDRYRPSLLLKKESL